MKTIIYAGPFQMPDKNAAAHRVLNNAKIFKKCGFEVVFAGLNPDAEPFFEKTYYEYEGFPIYELKAAGSFEKFKVFAATNWMEYLCGKYDVCAVIAYDYYAYSLIELAKFFRKKSIPVIADTDEWFKATGKSIAERIIRKVDSELRMRVLQPRADGIIAISSFLADYYKKKTCTVKIPPLVDKNEEKWLGEETPDENILNLVYSGSPGVAKDKLSLMVKLVSKAKTDYHVKLTVIGVTEKDFLAFNPQSENDLKTSVGEIVFLGRVPHSEALKQLKKADFSIFLRDINRVSTAGFPTKFVESISAGVPVITNKTSDLANYLKNGENGFLLSEDFEIELEKIFSMKLCDLKSVRDGVRSDMFHYEKYVSEMQGIIGVINGK